MSGIVSGLGKIFTSVASRLSTALGSAVTGVGATVATAGAATGGGLFSGGISSIVGGLGTGTGVLGNILNGVVNVATKGLGGLVETGMSAGRGLMSAFSPAVDAAASTAGIGGMAQGAAEAAPGFFDKAGDFLTSEAGAGLIGGLGKGWAEYEKAQMEQEESQKDRDYLLAKEMRIRDSYNVPGSALPDGASTGVVNDANRPTPATQYGRDFDMVYDPELGRIVRKARA
jgi:hypothetical protein